MSAIALRRTCRSCRASLVEVLQLGDLRLNAFPRHPWELEQIPRVPLILTVCTGCGLVQLDRSVPPDWMYRQYWYRSGVNETMVAELRAIVGEACDLMDVRDRGSGTPPTVLDIGANDGTLLESYRLRYGEQTPVRIAVEPALNLQEALQPHCDVLVPDYFPSPSLVGHYAIITAVAMAYDVERPLDFFQALHDLLAPGGVAVVQFQDFGQQLEAAAFDNICHEHLEYYTLWSLTHLFKQTGLMVQRSQHTPINGGSLRLHLRRQEDGFTPEPSVHRQLLWEAQRGLDTPGIREGNLTAFTTFRRRVDRVKAQIASTLETIHEQGSILDIYGASTKGNILLQVLGVGPAQARQVIDRSPAKHGCLTLTGIPIVSEEVGRREPADVWLCPIWGFRSSVLARERWYLQQGGTILFPLPSVEIVREAWDARAVLREAD